MRLRAPGCDPGAHRHDSCARVDTHVRTHPHDSRATGEVRRGMLARIVARIVSPAVIGLETATVEVEVDLRPGLPGFSVVGLPDTAVQEARERVRSGVVNQAFALPPIRIIANLAPADLRKAGPQYDLPIALALLCASSQVRPGVIAGTGAAGELALDGALRPVLGALVMAEHAARRGWRRLVVPAGNAAEASLVPGIQVLGARTLRHAVEILEGRADPAQVDPTAEDLIAASQTAVLGDLADVHGQLDARRALEIAAAGAHSLLMIGPPGGGKTMLARRLPGIMPPRAPPPGARIARQALGGEGHPAHHQAKPLVLPAARGVGGLGNLGIRKVDRRRPVGLIDPIERPPHRRAARHRDREADLLTVQHPQQLCAVEARVKAGADMAVAGRKERQRAAHESQSVIGAGRVRSR